MELKLIMFMIGCNVQTKYDRVQKMWYSSIEITVVIDGCSSIKFSSISPGFGLSIEDAVYNLYINYLNNK